MKKILALAAVITVSTLLPAAWAARAEEQAAAPAQGLADDEVKGTVLETMNAGGYTYVRVQSGDGELWAACYETAVAVGDEVTVPPGLVMQDFASPSLNRTFPSIRFVAALGGGAKPGGHGSSFHGSSLPPGHPSIDREEEESDEAEGEHEAYGHEDRDEEDGDQPQELPAGHPPIGGASATPAAAAPLSVAPPAGGLSIAEVNARRVELAGQEVSVRGTVVKYNENIMGRNWLHLQDGSGADAASGDITVTTDETSTKGAVVTATGKVVIDEDFGHGYSYKVLIEKASLSQ